MADENPDVAPEADHLIEFETENGTLESPEEAQPDPLEARLAEIREQYGEDSDQSQGDSESTDEEATEEVAAKTTETDPEADVEAKETEGQSVRKLLGRHKQLREERKQFDQERKEHQENLDQYEQAKKLASVNPIAFLKTLGLEQEQLEEVAKGIYYDALGDDAPDEYKGERQLQGLKQEIAQLKQLVSGGQAKKQEAQQQEQAQAALDQYIGGLQESLGELDVEASPNIGKIINAYGDQSVLQDMITIADAYGRENPTDAPLTAEEAFSYLEEEYGARLSKLLPTNDAAEDKKPAKKTKTLRNNISSKQPASEAPDPDKDWEAYKEYWREYGMNKVKDEYKKSGY